MRFREKNIRAPEENACTVDYYNGGDSNGNANTSIRLRGNLSKNRPLNFAWKKKNLPETLASDRERLYRDYD